MQRIRRFSTTTATTTTLLAAVVILFSPIFGVQALGAGDCGATSIANVPGCWGTPGCAYVIARKLGPGAACAFDYCNCGGTNVPLLPQTISGTPTVGCNGYTIQPSANNCPTAAPVISIASGSRDSSPSIIPLTKTTATTSSLPVSPLPPPPPPLPSGGVVVTGTAVDKQVITETYVPTVYPQFTTVTAIITTTIVNPQGSTITLVVGPSGEAWIPFNRPSGVADIPAPSALPSALRKASSASTLERPAASPASVLSGETVLTSIVGGQTVIETFVLTTITKFTSLASAITTTTLNAQQSLETVVIGPGGIAWAPLISQKSSGVPELAPPTILPVPNANAPSITPSSILIPSTITIVPSIAPAAGSTPISSSGGSAEASITPSSIIPSTITSVPSIAPTAGSTPISSKLGSAEAQSSVTNAFGTASETTLTLNGVTLPYVKATFSDLATITVPTTVTTQVAQTNKDGSSFTIPAAIIIVGPGGQWWNGGTSGFGIHGPSCIWPFCPPGGGGDIGGGGSGSNPNDPNTPGSNEKPNDPNEDKNSESQKATSTRASSSTASSSCSVSSIVSDCSVLCSTATRTSSTTLDCSTSCFSTATRCSATGTTVTSTASSAATGQPCSASCSACIAASIIKQAKGTRRDLNEGMTTKNKNRSKNNHNNKRTLTTPADYGGNTMQFLLSEYAFAEWLQISPTNPDSRSTAIARTLSNQRYDAAVHGLYGCTSVVVVSQQAVWISHFWEIPSFRASDANWGQPATEADKANFQRDVIDAMQNGAPDMPGLIQFTAAGGQFSSAQRPVWAIITPKANSGGAGDLRYDPEVTQIKAVLSRLFQASPAVIIDYVPRSDQNSQANTASGKILFQYDPYQALLANPQNPCEVFQQAMFRLWVEDRPNYVWQKYWAAEANQLIPGLLAQQQQQQPQSQKHKRDDDNPSCKIPIILPKASTATTGPNLAFSQAPDPDATSWITLNKANPSQSHPATALSSISSRQSIISGTVSGTASVTPPTTPAPTATPRCMADGAPWMSPTSYCDCGPSATYPTLPPISISGRTATTTAANCAYTVLPSSTIKPVSTANAPTNIPGVGGVPGCHYELAADQGLPSGSLNFCNCGGVTASLLTTTVSGTTSLNCNYSTVPPRGFNPVPTTSKPPPPPAQTPTTTPAAAPSPPYATGNCNVHVWEGLGQGNGQKAVYIDVTITDAHGTEIGSANGGLNWAQTLNVDSELANVLEVTPHSNSKKLLKKKSASGSSSASFDPIIPLRGGRRFEKRIGAPPIPVPPLQEKGPVSFAIGAQSWDSTSPQCSTGAYDNGSANNFFGALIFGDTFIPNRQMDCKFDC